MRHELANALLVVDVLDDAYGQSVAAKIRDFISEHDEEYKVIVGTKQSPVNRFHPALQAIPDVDQPYVADNIDFDSVFISEGGFHDPLSRAALVNEKGDGIYDYLNAHGIARVDVIGCNPVGVLFEAQDLGFTPTLFAQLCSGNTFAFMGTRLTDLVGRGIAVEGWKG